MNTTDSLERALGFHEAGQLAQAEGLYREILQSDPQHPGALHLLGMVAHQSGRHDIAIEFISRAIAIRGSQGVFHNNLGEAYRALGRTAEAQACYERALALDPALAAAHYNLGLVQSASQPSAAQGHYLQAIRLQPNFAAAHNNLGNLLRAQGKLYEAAAAYRTALRCQADYVEAIGNLGGALLELEQFSEAVEQLERAVLLRPNSAEAHFNLGNALKATSDWARAAKCYESALALRADFHQARCNLGNVLTIQGDLEGAKAAFLEILRREPDHVEALLSYGSLLQSQGEMDRALEHYERALRRKPDSSMAHFKRASVLMFRYQRNDAVAGFEEALRLEPNNPEAYINLASIYNDAGQPDAALDCCHKALELGSTKGALYGNMAVAFHAQGRAEEAMNCYRESLKLRPDNPSEHSNLLYAMNFMPQYAAEEIHAEHLEWARRHAEPLTAEAPKHDRDRSHDRRLRIAYVSPHFHQHAVNYFVEPILAAHDHDQFEVFCYASVVLADETTSRLKGLADHWRDVCFATDEQLAEKVRNDQIDILVDLSGHMGRTRLLAFARRPAPVQVTYLGYQNTTGMSAMDYRLTDLRADPPGLTDTFYTEKLVRLPRAFFCYQPFDAPAVTPLPALESGYVTFGSFNNFAKVMPEALDAWLKILARVPNSRLLCLAYRGGYLERHLHDLTAERGIDPARIELCDKRFRQDYLMLVQRADIALDPFPFNGHTTTCDAIWMGVPVVMLEGNSYASRFGGSVLANVGLEKLITRSVEDYIDRAVELASDLDGLSRLRSELRATMAASPLLDFKGFTRNLEQAYRQMWIDWCRREG
jgi:predicted O-linked N-acetylglucosamine transferase (SPINDLY family)